MGMVRRGGTRIFQKEGEARKYEWGRKFPSGVQGKAPEEGLGRIKAPQKLKQNVKLMNTF